MRSAFEFPYFMKPHVFLCLALLSVAEVLDERAEASRGRALFAMNGCAACHAIRGTSADGRIGPDLTHIGGRSTLAAAALPNRQDTMARWIAAPHRSKPGALMPAFDMLPAGDLQALAAYLSGLR